MTSSDDLSEAIRASLLRYLAAREHSREELRTKLRAKGYPLAQINEVITELAESGLQSDTRFAELFIRGRVAKGYGAQRIRMELKQRGIEADVTAELDEYDWDRRIHEVYTRKYRQDRLPETLRERSSCERFLRGRGFSGEEVRRLFRRLRDGDD